MTTINPLDVSLVTRAIESRLTGSARDALQNVLIERSEEIPDAPPVAGWVGIYAQDDRYVPRTIGLGNGFRNQESDIVCLIKMTDLHSGADCEIRLGALVAAVVGELLTDTTLNGTVSNILALRSAKDRYARAGYLFEQYAAVYVTVVQPVEVSNS